jgi:hypothetical protein
LGYAIPHIDHKDKGSVTHNMVVHIRGPVHIPSLKELCVEECRQHLDLRACLFQMTQDLGEEIVDV